ncbi:bacteriocin fulvocin C-related protein [Fodinicola feengrottensis]
MARRKAIIQASTPRAHSDLWLEQVRRFRAGHPELAPNENSALDIASEVLHDETVFGGNLASHPGVLRRLDHAQDVLVQAFSPTREKTDLRPDIRELFSWIGPNPAVSTAKVAKPADGVPGCECNSDSTWGGCPDSCYRYNDPGSCPCGAYSPGCGFASAYECDGLCNWDSDWCH